MVVTPQTPRPVGRNYPQLKRERRAVFFIAQHFYMFMRIARSFSTPTTSGS